LESARQAEELKMKAKKDKKYAQAAKTAALKE
jgi:hypothetical protein